ncbi:hypothetical protein QYM36_017791, partial [Artemia franciscana]
PVIGIERVVYALKKLKKVRDRKRAGGTSRYKCEDEDPNSAFLPGDEGIIDEEVSELEYNFGDDIPLAEQARILQRPMKQPKLTKCRESTRFEIHLGLVRDEVIFTDRSDWKPEDFFTQYFSQSFFNEAACATNYTYEAKIPQESEWSSSDKFV